MGNPQAKFFRGVGKRKETLSRGHAEVGVVRDQNVSIQVQIIAKLGELGASADENTGLNHATEHRFEAGFARGLESFERGGDPTGFDELDIDAMETFRGVDDVLGEVVGFIAEYR